MQILKRNKIKVTTMILGFLLLASVFLYFYTRYHTKPLMVIDVK